MARSTLKHSMWLLAATLAFTACDDDPSSRDGDTLLADASLTDASLADGALPDATVDPQPDMGPDAEVDAAPVVLLDAPEAWIYATDPITDDGELTRTTVTASTDPEGLLTSASVQVFNCLNEPGGDSGSTDMQGFHIEATLCHEVQTVRPDPDGHYLSVQPPEDHADGNDPFAEVMMYAHVNVAHDYFKGTHAFSDLDYPLPAIVNFQLQTNLPPALIGMEPGADGWLQFANAAFFPEESWDMLADSFGLPHRGSDSIIFGQAGHDFSYDARVIYHEYTHAVIGTGRLQTAVQPDRYGLDNSSFSMNEGLADYFSATLSDGPEMGVYGIGMIDPAQVRDVSVARKCPENVEDEVHLQGRIIGSTLWALREALGPQDTDTIVFGALMQFSPTTTHDEAATLFLAEAAILDEVNGVSGDPEGAEAIAEGVFTDFGLLGCVRSRAWRAFPAAGDLFPHLVEGTSTVGAPGFEAGVPAYKQFYVDVAPENVAIELTWSGRVASSFGVGEPQPMTAPLELSLRRGEAIELTYEDGVSRADDARLVPEVVEGQQRVVLTGACLPEGGGRLHTLFVNHGRDQVQISEMTITPLNALPEGVVVEDCVVEAE